MPWWYVRCYGADGQLGLSGWVSGTYLRVAGAPSTDGGQSAGTDGTGESEFAAPVRGRIVITSTPAGAVVSIDNSPIGLTPVDVLVPYGTRSVHVALPGYMPYATLIELKKPKSAEEVETVRIVAPLMLLLTPSG
jgi:hypothetical protein